MKNIFIANIFIANIFIANIFILVIIASIALTWSESYGYHKCMQDHKSFVGIQK